MAKQERQSSKTFGQMISDYTDIQKKQSQKFPELMDRVGNLQEIYNQELMKVMRDMVRKMILLEFEVLGADGDATGLRCNSHCAELYHMVRDRMNALEKKKPNQAFFITLNFLDEASGPDLRNGVLIPFVLKKIEKVYVKDWFFVVEQRCIEKDEKFGGYHIHLLIETNRYKKKSDVIREFYGSFKKYMFDPQKVDVRDATHSFNQRVDYMLGDKKDAVKLLKCKHDLTFRQEFELEDFYTSDEKHFMKNHENMIVDVVVPSFGNVAHTFEDNTDDEKGPEPSSDLEDEEDDNILQSPYRVSLDC